MNFHPSIINHIHFLQLGFIEAAPHNSTSITILKLPLYKHDQLLLKKPRPFASPPRPKPLHVHSSTHIATCDLRLENLHLLDETAKQRSLHIIYTYNRSYLQYITLPHCTILPSVKPTRAPPIIMASAPTGNEQVPSGTAPQSEGEPHPIPVDAKMANKKDTSLKEFLSKMDDYAPIVSCLV